MRPPLLLGVSCTSPRCCMGLCYIAVEDLVSGRAYLGRGNKISSIHTWRAMLRSISTRGLVSPTPSRPTAPMHYRNVSVGAWSSSGWAGGTKGTELLDNVGTSVGTIVFFFLTHLFRTRCRADIGGACADCEVMSNPLGLAKGGAFCFLPLLFGAKSACNILSVAPDLLRRGRPSRHLEGGTTGSGIKGVTNLPQFATNFHNNQR